MPLLSERRRYDMSCPIACALDMLGERWTLLILRELLPGPLRFSELKSAIVGINATILSRRLDQMREAGLAQIIDINGLSTGYAATPRSETLWPILLALASWGADASVSQAEGLTPAAAVTAFVALRPSEAPQLPIGFTLAGQRLEWQPGDRVPLRRRPGQAAVEISTTPHILLDLVTGRSRAAEVLNAGQLIVSGEAHAFLDHLPARA